MTNEEAIKILDQMPIAASFNFTFEEMAEALQMATKSLKNEKPQGEWIVKQERAGAFVGDRAVYSYTCPFCKVKEFAKYPYCHCGADMRGMENDL